MNSLITSKDDVKRLGFLRLEVECQGHRITFKWHYRQKSSLGLQNLVIYDNQITKTSDNYREWQKIGELHNMKNKKKWKKWHKKRENNI